MTASIRFSPDRWLVCSERVFHAISITWAADAPPDGLFRLRLEQKFIEAADFASLPDRFIELSTSGVRTAYLVINEMTKALALSLLHIRELIGIEVNLQILEWKEAPLDVIAGLSAPDQQLLDKLLRNAETVTFHDSVNSPFLDEMPQWWKSYVDALRQWEQTAREIYGIEFNELYSAQPISWEALTLEIPPTQVLNRLPQSSVLNDGHHLVKLPIFNTAWREEALMPMAAADHMPLGTPIEITSEKYDGDWIITTATVVGAEDQQYLIFECNPDKTQEYEGRPVQVTIGVITFDLGIVDHNGIAELRIDGMIDLLQKIIVVIGDKLEQTK